MPPFINPNRISVSEESLRDYIREEIPELEARPPWMDILPADPELIQANPEEYGYSRITLPRHYIPEIDYREMAFFGYEGNRNKFPDIFEDVYFLTRLAVYSSWLYNYGDKSFDDIYNELSNDILNNGYGNYRIDPAFIQTIKDTFVPGQVDENYPKSSMWRPNSWSDGWIWIVLLPEEYVGHTRSHRMETISGEERRYEILILLPKNLIVEKLRELDTEYLNREELEYEFYDLQRLADQVDLS